MLSLNIEGSYRSTFITSGRNVFKVVTVANGKEAAVMLLQNDHGITLMVIDINVPDIFELIHIIENKTRLPIAMMCDTDDKHLIMSGLQSGAMLCLLKPLCRCKIEDICRLPFLKHRQIMLESRPPLMSRMHEAEPVRPESSSEPSSYKRRKIEIGRVWSMGQSSQFVWTPDVQHKFMCVVQDLGISNAAPTEVARRMNIPGVTRELVVDKLKQLWMGIRGQLQLQFRMGQHPNAAFNVPRNPPAMVGPHMGQKANNNYLRPEGDYNRMTRYMQNPYSREQLKRIISATQHKWALERGVYAANSNASKWAVDNFVLPPPPRTTVSPSGLVGPPLLVPVALAQHIEVFIYNLQDAIHGIPGPLRTAPEAQGGPGPSWVENIDADDLLDAINELQYYG